MILFLNIYQKVPYCHKNTLYYLYTSSYYLNRSQGMQWANPCSLILNTEGATDHRRLKGRSECIVIVVIL